jgi:hypothetical protein
MAERVSSETVQPQATYGLGASYLGDVLHRFRGVKSLADRAVAQVSDQDLVATPDPEDNSVALIIKHVAGNLHARWRGFPTSDGESHRDRDSEFELQETDTRASLMQRWDTGWQCLFDALASLAAHDLARTVRVRGRSYSVMQAINRQLVHYAYHVGQIVFLAKHWSGSDWQSLSVPRGGSEAFNRMMGQGLHKPGAEGA